MITKLKLYLKNMIQIRMEYQTEVNFLLYLSKFYQKWEKIFLIKKNDEVAEEGMNNFDLNKNGTIEYDEFNELINFLISEKGYKLPQIIF